MNKKDKDIKETTNFFIHFTETTCVKYRRARIQVLDETKILEKKKKKNVYFMLRKAWWCFFCDAAQAYLT